VLTRVKREEHKFGNWLDRLEARSPKNVAIVAMANKLARVAWAVLTSGHVYSAESARKEKMEIALRLLLSLTCDYHFPLRRLRSFQPGLQADSLMAEQVHPTHLEP
jgi:hypothetical protein